MVNDSDRISCRGYCGNSFHMICAKVDYGLREALGSYDRNLFWMCDGCADLFASDHFRKMASCCTNENTPDESSFKSLKDDIAGLKEAVGILSAKVDSNPSASTFGGPWNKKLGSNVVPNTPKRKRDDDQSVERPSTTRGTKAASEVIQTVSPPANLLWIYLSAFAPSTTDDDIVKLTRDCLNLNADVEPKVVRLVPKDKDPATLSFVTFKVGVSKDLKNEALSKETWPENVYFREFENYPKNRRVVSIATNKSPSGTGVQ